MRAALAPAGLLGAFLATTIAPPASAGGCETLFGEDFCRFVSFSQKQSVPSPKADAPPIPERKPVIVPIDADAIGEMARPTFMQDLIHNFHARFAEFYDVEEFGLDVIQKVLFAQLTDGAGVQTAAAEEVVTRLRKIQSGNAQPYDGVVVAIEFGNFVTNTLAQEMLSKRWRGTAVEQVSEHAGAVLLGTARGAGTSSAMMLLALRDTLVDRGPDRIPEDLVLYELEAASRLTCKPGSPPRATEAMFSSPREHIVVVKRSAVDCTFAYGNETCEPEGCLTITYGVRPDGTWDQIDRMMLPFDYQVAPPPTPVSKPNFSPPIPESKPFVDQGGRIGSRGRVGDMQAALHEKLRQACLRIIAERVGDEVLPAQCYQFVDGGQAKSRMRGCENSAPSGQASGAPRMIPFCQ